MRTACSILLICGLAPFSLAQHIAPTEAKTPAEERATFRVPEGFEVQLVAAEPSIGKPIQIAFDHLGRLWVTTSRHYPFPADPNTKPSDKLYILSDFAENGQARKVTTFADNLNIPIGVLPLPDGQSCLVSHVGSIVKLTDTNNDGKADQHETILSGFGSRDTHGMMNSFVLLPDGWVYACHGFSNESRVKAKDGSEIRMRSGNTFRFRPDGSRVEPWTFGQVNPFGMTVDPYLNLYTADCHTRPITQLIHGSYYDSFGAPHDGLGYGPHATKHDHGSTALCGLAWYQASHFPQEWNGCMFLGNVVTNRINVDRINWVGGTPIAQEMKDFLTSSDPWFRPTDIKLGPDGALYFADFYNRIIGHYEVDLKHPLRDKDRGRVWRIVWKGRDGSTAPPKMPSDDLTKIPFNDVVNRLLDDNLVVRVQAANDLVRRLKAVPNQKPNLAGTDDIGKVTTAVGLFGIAGEQSNNAMFDLATYSNVIKGVKDEVLQKPTAFSGMTVRAIGTRASWGAEERGLMLFVFNEYVAAPHILRAALDGVLLHPHPEFVPALLKLLEQLPAADVNTRHAVRIALRNSLREPGGWEQTAALTDDQLAQVAEIALGVHQPNAAQFLLDFQTKRGLQPKYCQHIGRFGTDAQSAGLLKLIQSQSQQLAASLVALDSFSRGLQARAGQLPSEGRILATKLCEEALQTPEPQAIQATFNLLGNQKLAELAPSLQRFIKRADREETQRVAAWGALLSLNNAEGLSTAAGLLTDSRLSLANRERIAQMLGSQPQLAARTTLVNALATAPAKLASGIALALANSPGGSDALLEQIQLGKASARLLQDKAIVAKLTAHDGGKRASRVTTLTKGLPSADAQIQQTMRDRLKSFSQAKVDAVAGKQLFTTKCAICHQMSGEGAKVGPNLDSIGVRGPERLLEDILDPNRNIDATFRATILSLHDGRVLTGQLVREEGEVLILVDAQGKEQRISKKDVEKRTTSPLSVMPANFHELPEAELANLLGYLLQSLKK